MVCGYYIKRRYFVIIYFGHFWPPDFCLIPVLYAKLPALYSDICLSSSTVLETYVFGSPIGCFCLVTEGGARTFRYLGGGRRGREGGKNICAGFFTKLFWIAIYCAHPRPNTRYQYDFLSLRVLSI